jgi:hypothetical protein
MKLRDMPEDRLAYNVWVADIELMLAGCRHCWTYKLLDTLSLLGAVPRAAWDHRSSLGVTKDQVMGVCIAENVVNCTLHSGGLNLDGRGYITTLGLRHHLSTTSAYTHVGLCR